MSDPDLMRLPDTLMWGVPVYLDVSDVPLGSREVFVATCVEVLKSYRDEFDLRGRQHAELMTENLRLLAAGRGMRLSA